MPRFDVFVDGEGEASQGQELKRKQERKALGCIINNALPDSKVQTTKTQKSFTQKHKRKQEEMKACQQGQKDTMADGKVVEDYDFFIICGYQQVMVENMRQIESKHLVRRNYMDKQEELSLHMRAVLIDWLVDVSSQFNCTAEVIFVTVNYLDRFLSMMAVKKCRLQLLGLTCLNIAWKHEDANSRPNLNDLIYYTDHSCTCDEVVMMEQLVVRALDFHLMTATPLHFLCTFVSQSPLPRPAVHAAKHLLESCLLDGSCSMRYQPSLLAASCLFIVRADLKIMPWDSVLTQLTTYPMDALEGCVKDLHRLRMRLPLDELTSVDRKYEKMSTSQS